ncbi:MAG: carboxylesterase family protein [Actinomycetia bacterium]|nr:carboxylesterase family protein [Actinomycetes bacterium]
MTAAPTATTSLGTARGVRLESGVEAFLGMPYAAPAEGVLRFAPPQPVTTWGPDVLDASSVGAPPPQFPNDRLHLYPIASEDCLWLNVWTPAGDHASRPVMVWIHGGGWLAESAADPMYFGHLLSAHGDVVVVSLEYRQNVFGFGHLSAVPGSGNAGLLDQVAGLQWVRDNIAAFGGDPGNVTVFGESAGGMSVSALLGMPRSRGLFHRAVMQSNVASTIRRPEFAGEITRRIAASALGTIPDAGIDVGSLRELPWQQLLDAAVAVAEASGLTSDVVFGPVNDGDVFAETPMRSTASGLNTEVPVMLGFTLHETRYWYDLDPVLASPEVTAELILDVMAGPALPVGRSSTELVDLLRTLEPDMSPVQLGLAGLDDCFFRQPVLRQAEAHTAAGRAPAYLYRFDWEPIVPRDHDFDYGCPHSAELGLMLGTADAYPEMYDGQWPAGLARQMMDTWVVFARTGNPNHAGLPHWPSYDLESRPTMAFDADADEPTTRLELGPDSERLDFWSSVPFDGITPSFSVADLAV